MFLKRFYLAEKALVFKNSLRFCLKKGQKYLLFWPLWLSFLLWDWPLLANEMASKKGPQPNALEQFFPFILLGLLFYFLLIRPQQKRHKQHGSFLSQIKRGDEVLTNSGIYGRIEGLTDSFVILEVAEGVRIRVVKSQIASWTKSEKDNKSQKTS